MQTRYEVEKLDKLNQILRVKKNISINFSKNLKTLLSQRGISYSSLASKIDTNKNTLNDWLHGRVPRGLKTLIKIANFFEITLDELILNTPRNEKKTDPSRASTVEGKFIVEVKRVNGNGKLEIKRQNGR